MQLPPNESAASHRSSPKPISPLHGSQSFQSQNIKSYTEDCEETYQQDRGFLSPSFPRRGLVSTESTSLVLSALHSPETYMPSSNHYCEELSFCGPYNSILNRSSEMLSPSAWGSSSQYSAGTSSYPSSTSSTQSYYSNRPTMLTPSRNQQNLPSLAEIDLNSTSVYASRSSQGQSHGRHHNTMGYTSSTGGYFNHPANAMDISYTATKPSLASPYTNLHSNFSPRSSYGHNSSYSSNMDSYSPTVDPYAYSNGHSWPPTLPYPSGYPTVSDTSSIGSGRRRRGNLPKHVTDILRTWFHEHLDHPYPTDEDKQMLIGRTNLSISQISNWFINARRRHWPQLKAERERLMQGQGGGYKSGLGK